MNRPHSIDKMEVKKGLWSSEEDALLVTYVQNHGPRNWSNVSSKTGLKRCSKSCRNRWVNYLQPGVKHGNFTNLEERIIIHSQALLGNRWATIASFLPNRTDNDIKNYWNTYLKIKVDEIYGTNEGQSQDGFSDGVGAQGQGNFADMTFYSGKY